MGTSPSQEDPSTIHPSVQQAIHPSIPPPISFSEFIFSTNPFIIYLSSNLLSIYLSLTYLSIIYLSFSLSFFSFSFFLLPSSPPPPSSYSSSSSTIHTHVFTLCIFMRRSVPFPLDNGTHFLLPDISSHPGAFAHSVPTPWTTFPSTFKCLFFFILQSHF